jgi:hypothetical protein
VWTRQKFRLKAIDNERKKKRTIKVWDKLGLGHASDHDEKDGKRENPSYREQTANKNQKEKKKPAVPRCSSKPEVGLVVRATAHKNGSA